MRRSEAARASRFRALLEMSVPGTFATWQGIATEGRFRLRKGHHCLAPSSPVYEFMAYAANPTRRLTAGPASYQPLVAFTILTTDSITGTSISTPTTVASAAPD